MIKYKNLEQIIILDKNGNFKEFKDNVKPLIGDIIIHLDGSKAYIQGDENNETLPNIDIINDNDEIQNINYEVNALIQALEEGVDPTLLGDEFATAAGEAVSGSSLSPSGSINRTGAETIPSTVFETLGIPSIPLSQTQFLTLNDLAVNNSEPILTIENIILNSPPIGNNIDVTTNEDTEISGNVIVFDDDDDLLTYSLVNNTSNGEFTLFEDGSWTYLPNNNFDGNDFVDVLINDGNEGETEIRINFTIVPIPEIIISGDSEVSEGEYSFYTINLDKESTQETSLKLSLSYINAEESDIDNVTAFIDGSEIEISEDGIINIPSGITTISVNVKTFPDDNLEGNESFVLNVEPIFGLINSGSVETVIQDQGQNNGDNDIPSISISGDLSVNEGEYSNYLIKLSNETELESKFILDIQNISTEIDDFEYIEIKDINGIWNTVLNRDEITFPDNVFELELRIKTSQNDILEGNESFIVNVIGTENISNNSQISTTIKDDGAFNDDDRPTVSISGDSDIGEGEYAYYNVLIDKQSDLDLNVFVELSNISTKIDDIELFEYKNGNNEWISMPNDGILTFIAGVDRIELRVKSLQDDIFENNETFEISVNGLGDLLGEDSIQTNILDDGSINDDDRPTVSISGDSDVSEGDYAYYTLLTDKQSELSLEAKIFISNITTNNLDLSSFEYLNEDELWVSIPDDGVLTFLENTNELKIRIGTFQDEIFEGEESFSVNVLGLNDLLGEGSVQTNVLDNGLINDDDRPTVSISGDLNVSEGDYAYYALSIDKQSELDLNVFVELSNISTEIDDIEFFEYKNGNNEWISIPNDGVLTFLAGNEEIELRIKSLQDDIFENSETFEISVNGLGNLLGEDSIQTNILDDGSINDDDRPTVSISGDLNVSEGDYAYYNVSINKEIEEKLDFKINLLNISTENLDLGNIEYQDKNNNWNIVPNDGILSFDSSVDNIKIRVSTNQDDIFENSEVFEISVNGLGNLLEEDSIQTNILDDGSINDDDRPTVSISGDSDISEGDYAYYKVSIDKQSELDLNIFVELSNISTEIDDINFFEYKNDNNEWISIPNDGVLTFVAGNDEIELRVKSLQDDIFENSETFEIIVNGLGELLGEDSIQTNILDDGSINDDDRPTISISGDSEISEGNYAYYNVSIDKETEEKLYFEINLSNISTEDSDLSHIEYQDKNNNWNVVPNDGILSFDSSVDNIKIRILTNQDYIFENNETFEISVNGLDNLLGEDSIQTNILDDGTFDDDDRPTVSISGDSDVSEGDYAYYALSIDKQSELDLNVFVELSNISTEIDDIEFFEYKNDNNEWIPIPNDGILTFLAGNDEIELRVKSSQNDIFEGEESFEISVNGLGNLLGEDSIQTNILDDGTFDDDDRPTVSISGGGEINEGDYAYFNVNFDKSIEVSGKIKLILILNDISYDDIYNIEIQNDNGDWSVLDEDGVVNIDIGLNNLNVRILTNDDSVYEEIESFELKAVGYNNIIGESVSSASIIDNDNTAPIANDFIIDVFGGTENLIFDDHISDIEDNLNDKPLKIIILDTPDYGYLYYFNETGERIVLNENDSLYEGMSIEYSINPNLFNLDEILPNYSFNAEEKSNLLDGTSSLTINDIKISGGVFDSDSFVFNEEGALIYDHAAGEKGFAINTSGNNGHGDENGIDEYLELSFDDIETNELKLMLGSVNGLFNSDKGSITAYLYKDGILIETINEIDIEEREGGHNKEGDAFIVSNNSFNQIRLVVESNHGQGAGYVLQGVSVTSLTNISNINDSFSYQVEDSDGLLSESAIVGINNHNVNYLSSEYINYLEIDENTNALNLTKISEEGINTSLINDIENGVIIKSGDERDYMSLGDYDDTIYLGDSEGNINCENSLCDVFENKNIDIVYSNGGNDVIYGEDGDDVIFAGNDNDSLYGGNDNDLLYGEDGDDFLDGGDGDDILIGGDGNDVLIGGEGYDIFKLLDENLESNQIDIIVDFESGIDKIDFSDFLDDSVLLDDILNLNIKDNDLELELKNEDYSIIIKDGVDKYSESISGGYLDSLHILNDLLIVDEN